MKKLLEALLNTRNSSSSWLLPGDQLILPELPDETWQLIFTFLDYEDVSRLARGNRRLNNLSRDKAIWLPLIQKFLCTHPKIENGKYKEFFAEHYPLLKAVHRKTEISLSEKEILSKLDVLFGSYLHKYEKSKISARYFFPLVATNFDSLKRLLDFFGPEVIKKEIQKEDSGLNSLVRYLLEALDKSFANENKECLQLLLRTGLRTYCIFFFNNRMITMSLLSKAILSRTPKFTTFLMKEVDSIEITATINNLLGFKYTSAVDQKTWFEIITTNIEKVEKSLLEILETKDISLNHDQFEKIISLDMSSIVDSLLNNKLNWKLKFEEAEAIVLSAIKYDSIKVFSILQNHINLHEIFSQPILHLFIDHIKKLKKLRLEDEGSSRIYNKHPTFIDTTYAFIVPKNCIKFVDLLVSTGSDVNEVNDRNMTALESAIQTGCNALVSALLKNGAAITDEAIHLSEPFPSIKCMLEWGMNMQKEIKSLKQKLPQSANNNELLTNQKPMTTEELRLQRINFFNKSHYSLSRS